MKSIRTRQFHQFHCLKKNFKKEP